MGWTNEKILKNKKETEENEETEENNILKKIQRKFDKEISNRSIVNSETKKIKLLSEVSSDDEFIFTGTDKIHDLELFWDLYFSSSARYIYLVPTDEEDYVLFFNLTPTSNGLLLYYHILSEDG